MGRRFFPHGAIDRALLDGHALVAARQRDPLVSSLGDGRYLTPKRARESDAPASPGARTGNPRLKKSAPRVYPRAARAGHQLVCQGERVNRVLARKYWTAEP